MAVPVKKKVKVIEAKYVDDVKSIVLLGECSDGRFIQQINRSCFSYGDRTEKQIVEELHKTAKMMIGNTINMVFDPELDSKIDDRTTLRY